MTEVPVPGSHKAGLAGCTCPVHANNAGTKEPQGGWHVAPDCAVHSLIAGVKNQQEQVPDAVIRPRSRTRRAIDRVGNWFSGDSEYVPLTERTPDITRLMTDWSIPKMVPPGDPVADLIALGHDEEFAPPDALGPDPGHIAAQAADLLPPVAVAEPLIPTLNELDDIGIPPEEQDLQNWGARVVAQRKAAMIADGAPEVKEFAEALGGEVGGQTHDGSWYCADCPATGSSDDHSLSLYNHRQEARHFAEGKEAEETVGDPATDIQVDPDMLDEIVHSEIASQMSPAMVKAIAEALAPRVRQIMAGPEFEICTYCEGATRVKKPGGRYLLKCLKCNGTGLTSGSSQSTTNRSDA